MRPFLAIETATDVGSVAVGTPGAIMGEVTFGDRRHAAALVPAIEEALRVAGLGYGELHGIVVADGPGSFTGLRIGVATAKGILRQHESLSLRTAPSLMATAFGAQPFFGSAPVAALYDALRGEVFGAVYAFREAESGGRAGMRQAQAVVPPTLTTVTDLVARCPAAPAVAVGDGAVAYADAVRVWTGREPVGPPLGAPRAAGLLGLLAVDGATVAIGDPAEFEPVYGRLAEAQARWEREHGRPLPDSAHETG